MLARKLILSAAACLVAAAVFAEEPECANNYKSDGSSAETSVLTTLAPNVVIERLPRKLAAAGASMQSSEPDKGTLTAAGLTVKAAASDKVTRVTFHSSPAADKATLCRYAALVGNPPPPPKPEVPQDPALIAKMKDDLIKKHEIIRIDNSHGLNHASFRGLEDFLEFKISGITETAPGKRQYEVSMLLPRDACGVVIEDIADSSVGLLGNDAGYRRKPVHIDATLLYTIKDGTLVLDDATIVNIASIK